MSTGAQAAWNVSIRPESEQQHFRLLELPADLLTLITSENSPRLQLKSREATDASTNDANLVLCTPDQTYNVRQVNTSNSVWVAQSSSTASQGGSSEKTASFEAIARIESTLELLQPSNAQSAAPYIQAALPVFVSTGNYSSSGSISKHELFSHIPLDEARCNADFQSLAAFEAEDAPGYFVPSVKVRMRILEQLNALAPASGVDLTTAELAATGIPDFAADMGEDWPSNLIIAVIRSVSSSPSDSTLKIDKSLFVLHAGLSLLRTRAGSASTETKPFVKAWKDMMPEKWRESCQLSALGQSYKTHDGGLFVNYVEGSNPIFDMANQNSPGEANKAAALGAKRNWHEKFRPSKKT